MSNKDDNHPLIDRLAVQRQLAPGVLDRAPLQRRYEKLHRSAVTRTVADRLHGRLTPIADHHSDSLVWQQSSGHLGSLEMASPAASQQSLVSEASARSPAITVQRAALPITESASAVSRKLLARQETPGVVPSRVSLDRSVAATLARGPEKFAAQRLERYGAVSSTAAATTQLAGARSSPIPTSVVMRKQDASGPVINTNRTATAPAARASTFESAPRVIEATPMTRISTAPTVLARKSSAPTPPVATVAAATLPTKTSTRPSNTTSVDALQPFAVSSSAATSVLEHTSRRTSSPQMILQRVMADPQQSKNSQPLAVPVAGVPFPGSNDAPTQFDEVAKAAPAKTSVESEEGTDIDAIADEVERRLMRRLEIERERRGMRQ